LLEDSFIDKKHTEEEKNETIKKLAKRTYDDNKTFNKELPWLVTESANNGYLFGYELGKLDSEKKLLPEIIKIRCATPTESHPSQYFLGGYLRAIQEKEPSVWEDIFNNLIKKKELLPFLPEIAWRAGVTDNIINKLIVLTEDGSIDPALLSCFKYGIELRTLKEDTLQRFIKSLLSHPKKATASIALDVFARYYTDKEAKYELPKNLALEIITNPTFFYPSDGYRDSMDQYIWSKITQKFLDKFGIEKNIALKIGKLMLDGVDSKGSIIDHNDQHVKSIFLKILETYPDEMWLYALSIIKEKGYHIFKYWLGSNESFGGDNQTSLVLLEKIKLDTLWQWIDEDVEKRAWFIAYLVPNFFSNEPGKVCLAREILIRYGDRKDVRSNLSANFFSGSWSGKESNHYQSKLDDIKKKKETETNPKVIFWINEYIKELQESIEKSKIDEERDCFWA
jgi:hypothetical protein